MCLFVFVTMAGFMPRGERYVPERVKAQSFLPVQFPDATWEEGDC